MRAASNPEHDDVPSSVTARGRSTAIAGAQDSASHPSPSSRELRQIAAAFESARVMRVRTGEQIRRSVERAASRTDTPPSPSALDSLLAHVRSGIPTAVDPTLAQAYRRYCDDERELNRLMADHLARHPAWHWLGRVRGVGTSLGARLLARLDVERAPTPSSFWSYCGLATVTAELYRCAECGHELSLPAGRPVRPVHRVPGTGDQCPGALAPAEGMSRRVAQPRPTRGESAPYDREAKQLCYLIGTSLVREGDTYHHYYCAQRLRLDAAKTDWIPRRRHLTALRMTEKLFLAHLWLVWRERLGLPITAPYAVARDDAVPAPRPWSMVGA